MYCPVFKFDMMIAFFTVFDSHIDSTKINILKCHPIHRFIPVQLYFLKNIVIYPDDITKFAHEVANFKLTNHDEYF